MYTSFTLLASYKILSLYRSNIHINYKDVHQKKKNHTIHIKMKCEMKLQLNTTKTIYIPCYKMMTDVWRF